MTSLTRDQILASPNPDRVKVNVPEWGGYVWIHHMTGEERDAWEVSLVRSGEDVGKNMRAKMVALVCRDDDGKPIFEASDVDALGKKGAAALDRVFARAQRMNRLTVDSMKELEGNSEPSRSDGQS